MAGTGCDAVPVENAANRLVVSTFDYEGDDTDPAIQVSGTDYADRGDVSKAAKGVRY